jgi:hypothetical protein
MVRGTLTQLGRVLPEVPITAGTDERTIDAHTASVYPLLHKPRRRASPVQYVEPVPSMSSAPKPSSGPSTKKTSIVMPGST